MGQMHTYVVWTALFLIDGCMRALVIEVESAVLCGIESWALLLGGDVPTGNQYSLTKTRRGGWLYRVEVTLSLCFNLLSHIVHRHDFPEE